MHLIYVLIFCSFKELPDDQMRGIEMELSHQFDSYSSESYKLTNDLVVVEQRIGLDDTGCSKVETRPSDELDFTIEMFLVFNDFVKCLKIYSIVNEVIEMTEELMGVGCEA